MGRQSNYSDLLNTTFAAKRVPTFSHVIDSQVQQQLVIIAHMYYLSMFSLTGDAMEHYSHVSVDSGRGSSIGSPNISTGKLIDLNMLQQVTFSTSPNTHQPTGVYRHQSEDSLFSSKHTHQPTGISPYQSFSQISDYSTPAPPSTTHSTKSSYSSSSLHKQESEPLPDPGVQSFKGLDFNF